MYFLTHIMLAAFLIWVNSCQELVAFSHLCLGREDMRWLKVQEGNILTYLCPPGIGRDSVTHSSILAWGIPWTEKPGRLQSTGSHRVRHDWSDLAAYLIIQSLWALFFCIHKVEIICLVYKSKECRGIQFFYSKPLYTCKLLLLVL